MAKGYRPVDRDQLFLLPPDMRDWLPPDHPVWLVIRVVGDHLDTSAFHALRRTGGAGAAGYDPDMLVTVLVWAYAHQVTSSRRMEQLCGTDVAFKVICAGNAPDHATIARFRSAFGDAAGEFFARVLGLCARLGMGKLGVVALDGMKIAASASKAANRTGQTLAEMAAAAVAAHGETDAAEDALFGAGRRGDEVPADAWSPRRRDQRIAAALASLQAEEQAAEREQAAKARAFRERQRARRRPGPPPPGSAVVLAAEALAAARAQRAAQLAGLEQRYAAGQPRRGRAAGIDDYCRVREAAARLEKAQAAAAARAGRPPSRRRARKDKKGQPITPVRNITDPDARLMPVRGGFIEGYNTQNVTSEDGLIIATALTAGTTDFAWFEPMLRQAEAAAAFITARQPAPAPGTAPPPAGPGTDPGTGTGDDAPAAGPDDASLIGLFLADAGYLSEHNLSIDGPDRLIATGKHRDLEKAARQPGEPGRVPRHSQAIAAMAARLATPDGITAYRHRGHIAETPHGHIKHNMRFRQLSLRGKPKATAEWTFTTAVHNLFKAITTGHLTATALDNLTSHPASPA
jgi:transposase